MSVAVMLVVVACELFAGAAAGVIRYLARRSEATARERP